METSSYKMVLQLLIISVINLLSLEGNHLHQQRGKDPSKMNAYCLARMNAIFNSEGEVEVCFRQPHVGHGA